MLIKASYIGRVSEPAHLALLFRKALRQIPAKLQAERSKLRQKFADKLRAAKNRARQIGLRQAQTQANQIILNNCAELKLIIDQNNQKYREKLLEECLLLCKTVLHESLCKSRRGLLLRLNKTLQKLDADKIIKIKISPKNFSSLNRSASDKEKIASLQIEADPSVAEGNIQIETYSGTIQLCWEDHFAVLKEQLVSTISSAH